MNKDILGRGIDPCSKMIFVWTSNFENVKGKMQSAKDDETFKRISKMK